ncbi:hypothetical protein MTR67_047947 [Solanum verrucosum]|uniref:Retrotransposon gag domain-containing protein n=1 Tax=Solanum verrucosum TaxID=315347 RepID=A0AAF0UXJ8_SOLVR|nr:hypothetical protein MTR67_047947 [Solanum verrucosum]
MENESPIDLGLVDWDQFKGVFLDYFFHLEITEAKVLELINLRQGNMSVKEYALKFTHLAKHALTMAADSRARISEFVSGVSDLVIKECHTDILIKEIDIYHLMIHSQNTEKETLMERDNESKRARTSDCDFSHFRSAGHGRPQFQQKF